MYKNSHVTISEPHPGNYNNKIQTVLKDIGVKFYINNIRDKPTPTKRPIYIKEAQKNMKSRLGYENQMIIGMTVKYKFIGMN